MSDESDRTETIESELVPLKSHSVEPTIAQMPAKPTADAEGTTSSLPIETTEAWNEGEEEEVEVIDIETEADAIVSVVKPVTLTMALVIVVIQILTANPIFQLTQNAFGGLLVYQESSSDTGAEKFLGSLENALVILAAIVVATLVMVVLYKLRCTKVIWGYLIFSSSLLLGLFGGYISYLVLDSLNVSVDWISFVILVFNIAVVGVIAIFWVAPPRLTQGYLVFISVLMATSLTRLPEWTTWMVLAIVACYDVVAVLWSRGPLRVLVDTAQERGEVIPGLIYSTMTWLLPVMTPSIMHMGAGKGKGSAKRDIKLGLGDFIFYSVLVGRAALGEYPYNIAGACIIAILTGLCGTLFILLFVRHALPALPISIALGIVFYFVTRFAITPFVVFLNSNGVLV